MKPNTFWILVAAMLIVFSLVTVQAQSGQPSVDRSATLLVDTDDTCQLFVDDEDKGEVTPDKALKSTVGLGDHI